MIKYIKYRIFPLSLIFLISIASAADVFVAPSNKIVAQGEIYNLNISIDPLGTGIAGTELNLEFNKSMLYVNSITEGNLFKQNGASTFFNNGSIDNSVGIVENIYSFILGSFNVSTPGTFIIINATAVGSSGTSVISLCNVKIVDSNGNYMVLNVINGSVIYNAEATPTVRYINGTVMDNSTGDSLAGVTVSANSTLSTTSNDTGFYSFAVTDDTYNLVSTVNDIRFYTNTTTISTSGQVVVIQDIEMVRKPTGNITGSVTRCCT